MLQAVCPRHGKKVDDGVMKVLLVGRIDNGQLDQTSVQSFYQLGQESSVVDLFITLESDWSFSLPQSVLDGLCSVLVGEVAEVGAVSPEDLSSAIEGLAKEYDLVVAGKGHLMDQVMARCAASLGREPLLGITKIIDKNTLQYQAYNNTILKTVYSEAVPKIITIAPGVGVVDGAGDLADVRAENPKIKLIARTGRAGLATIKASHGNGSGDDNFAGAQIIIGCGAGVDSTASLGLAKELAKVLGAALGASKMTVDAGYLPASALIGQSGKAVSPKVYLALGVSGSMHHLGAVQGADIIIAVNMDSEAPIIKMSDYSLIGDVSEIVPKLTALLKDWDNHHGY